MKQAVTLLFGFLSDLPKDPRGVFFTGAIVGSMEHAIKGVLALASGACKPVLVDGLTH